MKANITIGSKVTVQVGTSFYPATITKFTRTTTVVTHDKSGSERRFDGVANVTDRTKLNEVGRHNYGTLWLDNEAAAAEQTNMLARAASEKLAEAKRKADKRAAEDKAVQDLVDFVRLLCNVQAVEGSEAAKNEARVRWSIGSEWLSTHEELLERGRQLAQHPASYFEWAESDMKLAAKREILDHIVYQLREGKHTLHTILRTLVQDITQRVMRNYDRPTSSSPTHNAMMIAKLDVRCQMIEKLNYWVEATAQSEAKLATVENPFCAPLA